MFSIKPDPDGPELEISGAGTGPSWHTPAPDQHQEMCATTSMTTSYTDMPEEFIGIQEDDSEPMNTDWDMEAVEYTPFAASNQSPIIVQPFVPAQTIVSPPSSEPVQNHANTETNVTKNAESNVTTINITTPSRDNPVSIQTVIPPKSDNSQTQQASMTQVNLGNNQTGVILNKDGQLFLIVSSIKDGQPQAHDVANKVIQSAHCSFPTSNKTTIMGINKDGMTYTRKTDKPIPLPQRVVPRVIRPVIPPIKVMGLQENGTAYTTHIDAPIPAPRIVTYGNWPTNTETTVMGLNRNGTTYSRVVNSATSVTNCRISQIYDGTMNSPNPPVMQVSNKPPIMSAYAPATKKSPTPKLRLPEFEFIPEQHTVKRKVLISKVCKFNDSLKSKALSSDYDVSLLMQRSKCFVQLGLDKKAVEDAEQALKLTPKRSPQYPDALIHMATVFACQGNFKKAIELMYQLTVAHPNPHVPERKSMQALLVQIFNQLFHVKITQAKLLSRLTPLFTGGLKWHLDETVPIMIAGVQLSYRDEYEVNPTETPEQMAKRLFNESTGIYKQTYRASANPEYTHHSQKFFDTFTISQDGPKLYLSDVSEYKSQVEHTKLVEQAELFKNISVTHTHKNRLISRSLLFARAGMSELALDFAKYAVIMDPLNQYFRINLARLVASLGDIRKSFAILSGCDLVDKKMLDKSKAVKNSLDVARRDLRMQFLTQIIQIPANKTKELAGYPLQLAVTMFLDSIMPPMVAGIKFSVDLRGSGLKEKSDRKHDKHKKHKSKDKKKDKKKKKKHKDRDKDKDREVVCLDDNQVVDKAATQSSIDLPSTADKIFHSDELLNLADEPFFDSDDYRAMVEMNYNGIYICKWAGCNHRYRFIPAGMTLTSSTIKSHVAQVHRQIVYQCSAADCTSEFISMFNLKNHFSQLHPSMAWPKVVVKLNHKTNSMLTMRTDGKRLEVETASTDTDGTRLEVDTASTVTNSKKMDKQKDAKAMLALFDSGDHRAMITQHTHGRYRCKWPGCQYKYLGSSIMKNKIANHVDLFHRNVEYLCPTPGCMRKVATMNKLRKHFSNLHYHIFWPNVVTQINNTTNTSRQVTTDDGLERRFVCTWSGCKQKFYRQDNVMDHINRDHHKIRFICNVKCGGKRCEHVSTQKGHIKAHILGIHNKQIDPTKPMELYYTREKKKITDSPKDTTQAANETRLAREDDTPPMDVADYTPSYSKLKNSTLNPAKIPRILTYACPAAVATGCQVTCRKDKWNMRRHFRSKHPNLKFPSIVTCFYAEAKQVPISASQNEKNSSTNTIKQPEPKLASGVTYRCPANGCPFTVGVVSCLVKHWCTSHRNLGLEMPKFTERSFLQSITIGGGGSEPQSVQTPPVHKDQNQVQISTSTHGGIDVTPEESIGQSSTPNVKEEIMDTEEILPAEPLTFDDLLFNEQERAGRDMAEHNVPDGSDYSQEFVEYSN